MRSIFWAQNGTPMPWRPRWSHPPSPVRTRRPASSPAMYRKFVPCCGLQHPISWVTPWTTPWRASVTIAPWMSPPCLPAPVACWETAPATWRSVSFRPAAAMVWCASWSVRSLWRRQRMLCTSLVWWSLGGFQPRVYIFFYNLFIWAFTGPRDGLSQHPPLKFWSLHFGRGCALVHHKHPQTIHKPPRSACGCIAQAFHPPRAVLLCTAALRLRSVRCIPSVARRWSAPTRVCRASTPRHWQHCHMQPWCKSPILW